MGKIVGIFEIGDTGESFMTAEWVPDPKVIQAQLLKFAVDSEIMAEPLAAAREAFIYDTSLHFETTSDPYGRAWTPLEASYLKRKAREGGTGNILHDTGTLEQAATSQGPWIITEREILFDLEKIPFYGPYHQAGTLSADDEKLIRSQRLNEGGIYGDVSNLDTRVLGAGRGYALPQRMFIGADEDTIAEIEEIFLKWLDGLIRKDWSGISSDPVEIYGSNVLGTFPIMKFFGNQPILRTPSGPRFGRI